VETGEYFRETARYGGVVLMRAVERLFQASSELVVAVLQAEDRGALQADRVASAVRAADAMAIGLGLDLEVRVELARRCRAACARGLSRRGACATRISTPVAAALCLARKQG